MGCNMGLGQKLGWYTQGKTWGDCWGIIDMG